MLHLTIPLTLLLSPLFIQSNPDGETILRQMGEAADKRQNLTYTLAVSIEAKQDGKPIPAPPIVSSAAISISNPGKLRMEYAGTLQVTDGNATWLYDSKTKQYTKTAAAVRLNALGLPPLTTFLPGAPIADLQGSPSLLRDEVFEADGQKHDCWVIQHSVKVPDAVTAQVKSAIIQSWIDKNRYVPLKHSVSLVLTATPPRELTATILVKSLTLDAAIPADKFTFTPPADSREVQSVVSRLNLTGTAAPRYNVRDLEGNSYSTESLKGKTVFLDFWATWCGPCRDSAPAIEKLHEDFKDKGLVTLGVDIGEDRKLVEAYLKPRPVKFPIVIGDEFGMENLFQISSFPTFIVIGADGKIAAHEVGYAGEARLRTMVSNVVLGVPNTPTTNAAPTGVPTGTPSGTPAGPVAAAYSPSSVTVDGLENLYVLDSTGRRVLKVPRDGPAVVVAGNGAQTPVGDGGPAVLAALDQPAAIAADVAGNLYIADNGIKRIRKVRSDGTIGSLEVSDLDRITGMAVDAAGNIYISEPVQRRVRKIASDGKTVTLVAGTGAIGTRGDGGPATAALLTLPMGLTLDTRGNLYIADPGARRVRRVATDGNIYLAAGNGSSGYSGDGSLAVLAQLKEPLALAVDASGSLLILDAGDFRIRKVTPDGNIMTAFGTGTEGLAGDGGPAAAAQFGRVTGLALDASGNLYLASPAHRRVRKIEASGIMSTVAGTALID